jgi:hypothetical protein
MKFGELNEENRTGNTNGEGSVIVNIVKGRNWSKHSWVIGVGKQSMRNASCKKPRVSGYSPLYSVPYHCVFDSLISCHITLLNYSS